MERQGYRERSSQSLYGTESVQRTGWKISSEVLRLPGFNLQHCSTAGYDHRERAAVQRSDRHWNVLQETQTVLNLRFMIRESAKVSRQSGLLHREEGYRICIRCSYGPEDNSSAVPEGLMTAPAECKANDTRCSKTEKSCKQGCLMLLTVSQLAAWPDITRITGRHFNHVSAAGACCHGPVADGVEATHKRAPQLSLQTRS